MSPAGQGKLRRNAGDIRDKDIAEKGIRERFARKQLVRGPGMNE
ncbi:hypothetical protein L21SP2_2800 [Salinispira pacifica]|uniref:Uncharacterized protein n=1 Tax=Salinispira pacifica TaxID=1307761 RepID=V5WKI1_9SPIO|nr:hypothetical protein L21SP2_2800 [Salinispira pacifica]